MFILADDTDVFVFWLGDGPIGTPRSIYKCIVNRDVLVLLTDPEISIPMGRIRLVHQGKWRSDIKMPGISCVTVNTDEASYSLWPVNPMRPNPWADDNYDEGKALKDVLTSLWRHQKPGYSKNPYLRQQIAKKKQKIIDLDAAVPPLDYWRQGRLWSKPFLKELSEGIWFLLAVLLLIVGMALVVDWLTG